MIAWSRRTFLGRAGGLAAATGLAAVAGGTLAACGASKGSAGSAATSTRPGPRGTATGYPAPGRIAADDLVDQDTLWSWIERMTGFGPRLTGSDAHRRYIDDLDRQLTGYGLTVTRYPTPLDQWLATAWSLRVVDARGTAHSVPVAYYRPHSGETGARGVTGPLVDRHAGAAADYQDGSGPGAIVLVDGAIAGLTASVLTNLAYYVHPPSARAAIATEDYSRVWLGAPAQPSLETAKEHGAVAMIEILDLTTPLAVGQYTPHQQEHAGLPALHVDPTQGARLRSLLAAGPVTATLTLEATRRPTTVDYLMARLPGSGAHPGSVLVATHTDGQNAIEENGGPALLALVEYFSRFPRAARPRDLLFMFSPSHMAAEQATTKPDVFLRHHPEITSTVAMALVAEHLGTMDWNDQDGTADYRATGRSELLAVPVGHSDILRDLTIEEVKASNLTRTSVQKPFQGGLYGEGTFAYRLGLPTVALISGPTYLLQVAPGDNLDKLDRTLLHEQTVFLARMLSRMIALPSARP